VRSRRQADAVVTSTSAARAILAVRSALFVPADRPDRFAKAFAAGADAVIVDLEDAVAIPAKDAGRKAALDLASVGDNRFWVLRMNHLGTAAGLADLLALCAASTLPPAVMLPKVESVAEVEIASHHLSASGAEVAVVALIETVAGLDAAPAIARHPAVHALALGGADLAAELGCDMAWEPLLHARSRLVQAAAGALPVWDVPFLDIADDAGLRREAESVRALGYSAKMAIHPAQVAGINAAFRPGAAQLDRARRIVAAFEVARGGVVVVDGRMVDAPVVATARRTLLRAGEPTPAERKA
jgi:(S)-citramalyl-CoA lyase